MSKIDEIIKNMSLKDKARQLTQIEVNIITDDAGASATGNTGWLDLSREDIDGIGSALNFSGAGVARKTHEIHNAVNNIPLVLMIDVVHGYRTVFPINIAMGGTFDAELAEACAEMSAIEAKYNGVHITFAPMVDLVRDARWGRVMESTGEDPYLNGIMGRAFIRGFKRGGLGVCVKHFAAYGACEGGRDYNTTDVSERNLREYYLRAYRECLKEEPELVMSSFNLLNGIPVNGHRELLVDMLRKEWGFNGVLISDYAALGEMMRHGYCSDLKSCAAVAANNEIDMEMMTSAYINYLPELVAEDKIKEETVDKMVRRVLELKEKLGLFDNPYKDIDEEKQKKICLCEEYRKLARSAAEKSCVLLKNNGVLPLGKSAEICLAGPFADEKNIIGSWACRGEVFEAVSVKEGVENLLGRKIDTVRGCGASLTETDTDGIPAAVETAAESGVIIACIGEMSRDSGEGASRADINIPSVQRELIKELSKLNKKLVLVVFGGRPQVLTDIEPYADAILYAWQPGTEGGNAIANLLFGEVSPSAKLTMSFPRSTGQCPIYYNHFSTGRPKIPDNPENCIYVSAYRDVLNSPLYPFGYGLTYTHFTMSEINLSRNSMSKNQTLTVSVTVKNNGGRAGEEVVQLYLHDKFASVVRPVKELKGYKKIKLAPGEDAVIEFTIDEDMLKFYTAENKFAAEAGEFEVFIGFDSCNVKNAEFVLTE